MNKLTDGMILYHGSYCEVQTPDLSRGARNKDFGQGFYLTSSREQAEKFIRTSVRKALIRGNLSEEQDYGIISCYKFTACADLSIKEFLNADSEWLHCVVAHRRNNTFEDIVEEMKTFDIITGKIANDNTNATIAAYMAMVYGEIGTKAADEMCISQLMPQNLKDQFCFRSENALRAIEFVGREKYVYR